MGEPRIYITRPIHDQLVEDFATRLGAEVSIHPDASTPPSSAELKKAVAGVDAIISLVTDRIDGEVMDAAGPQLKVIANVAVGYDNIDVPAARERGVLVTNTPSVLDDATADLAMALMLSTVRRVTESDRFIRTGEPWIWGPKDWVGLDVSAGARLGILGLGRIGMATAKRARAFGMEILATGSGAHSQEAQDLAVTPVTMEEMLPQVDVLSIHCPLTPENRHLIGASELAAMKQGSYLINTARGPLVDEEALADSLESGHLAGAGLDVHEYEPSVNQRLAALEQTVLLPHIGSGADTTRQRMADLALRNAEAVLKGQAALTPVS